MFIRLMRTYLSFTYLCLSVMILIELKIIG
jgi:hypothetical protein